MKSIKLLLTSDLHLGMDKKNSLCLKNERTETFKRIMAQAAKHDILLIAGDFFDSTISVPDFYEHAVPEITNLLEEGTEIFYTPGYEELSANKEITDYISSLNNCFYFSNKREDEYIKSDKGDLYIYGFQAQSMHSPDTITRCTKKGFHLGLFYADYQPENMDLHNKECLNRESMKQMNMDFYALGKSHFFKIFRSQNKIIGACPGSPEPCFFDESGDRFVISMEIINNSLTNIKRIPINTVSVFTGSIDCSAIKQKSDLIDKIKAFAKEDKILSIILTGIRNFELNKLENELAGYYRGLQIVNRTIPSLNMQISSFCNSNSLKGEIHRTLRKKIEDKNIPENINQDALAKILFPRFSSPSSREEVIFCDL
ncbi:MAG: metallophosphoesterase [Spirochaetota bacterium]